MGLFNGIKKAFNTAGSSIIVTIDKENYVQSDTVKGVITIVAPDQKVKGRSIRVELNEFWTTSGFTGGIRGAGLSEKIHSKVILCKKFEFQPESQHTFPFEVKLPVNCYISTGNHEWRLIATMNFALALDSREVTTIKVSFADDIAAVIKVFEKDFSFSELLEYRKWDNETDKTVFRFKPPRELQHTLEFLIIYMGRDEQGNVYGDLLLYTKEQFLSENCKKFFCDGWVRTKYSLSAQEIYTQEGTINQESIVQSIKKIVNNNFKTDLIL